MTDKGFDEQYDAGFGEDFTGQEVDYPREGPERREGMHWPTVLAAAGASLLVAALITTIGVVGALRYGNSEDKDATIAMYEQMLAADSSSGSGGNRAAGAKNAADRGTRGEQARADGRSGGPDRPGRPAGSGGSGSGSGSGDAGGGGAAGAGGGAAGHVDEGGADQDLAPAWGPVELDDNLHMLMNPGTGDGAIADSLEAGSAGVQTVRDIQARFEAAKLFYNWELDYDSVHIDGDALYADLTLTLSGMGQKPFPIYYLDIGAAWRLSNESLCDLAKQARVDCGV